MEGWSVLVVISLLLETRDAVNTSIVRSLFLHFYKSRHVAYRSRRIKSSRYQIEPPVWPNGKSLSRLAWFLLPSHIKKAHCVCVCDQVSKGSRSPICWNRRLAAWRVACASFSACTWTRAGRTPGRRCRGDCSSKTLLSCSWLEPLCSQALQPCKHHSANYMLIAVTVFGTVRHLSVCLF